MERLSNTLSLFITFHKEIYDSFYNGLSDESLSALTLYGVREKCKCSHNIKILYEEELPNYNPELQKRKYNEGSTMWHIYKNRIHKSSKYVGFFQYDMIFGENIVQQILDVIQTPCDGTLPIIFGFFFIIPESIARCDGTIQFIKQWGDTDTGGLLDHYNAFYGRKYTFEDISKQPYIMCNTYILPSVLFEKMMTWMVHYFEEKNMLSREQLHRVFFKNPGFYQVNPNISTADVASVDAVNPGHIIEIMSALFLAIEIHEGAVLYNMGNVFHSHTHRV
jgi:hypothetical protein